MNSLLSRALELQRIAHELMCLAWTVLPSIPIRSVD